MFQWKVKKERITFTTLNVRCIGVAGRQRDVLRMASAEPTATVSHGAGRIAEIDTISISIFWLPQI